MPGRDSKPTGRLVHFNLLESLNSYCVFFSSSCERVCKNSLVVLIKFEVACPFTLMLKTKVRSDKIVVYNLMSIVCLCLFFKSINHYSNAFIYIHADICSLNIKHKAKKTKE